MSTSGQGLLLTRQAGIATITLNHPERANALDPAEFHALATLLVTLGTDPTLRTVVLTGQGERAFCAGLNLTEGDAIRQDIASSGPTGLGAVLRAAFALPVPILGRINGACVAGGLGLLGACDCAIASTTARFGLPEIRHGMYPFVALAALHGRGAPPFLGQLAETGALIAASAALDAGLIDGLYAPAELDAAVRAQLEAFAAGKVPERMQRRLDEGLASMEQRLSQAEAGARQAAGSLTVGS